MTYHVPDHRTLDRSAPAQVQSYYVKGKGFHRVYAGKSETFPDTAAEARMVACLHNVTNGHMVAADLRETTEPTPTTSAPGTWTDSWLTAAEARAARGNES